MRIHALGLAVMFITSSAHAEEPADGSEARVLTCGWSSKVSVSVFRWEAKDGAVTLRHRTAELDTGAVVPKVRGKPPVGCPFGLPNPSAAWPLRDVTVFTRTGTGWVDAKGQAVTVTCAPRVLSAVRDGTALVANPRSDGCAGERQLILSGGRREQVPLLRCVVASKRDVTLTLTFGAELVTSDNDCGGGSDWRVNTP